MYRPFSSFQLYDISVSFDSHSVIGIAGANGSGKTTLIKILLRQHITYTGNYTVDTQPVTDMAANMCWDYGIGYSPDEPILDEVLTGYEIICLAAKIRSISNDILGDQLRVLTKFLCIDEWYKTQPCQEYSHGMRKKISIALAYIGATQFAILDEPLNGLDPIAVYGVLQLILYKKQQGIGTLVSSHILDFIEKCADSLILMKQGTLLYAGTVPHLYEKYTNKKLDEIYFSLFQSL